MARLITIPQGGFLVATSVFYHSLELLRLDAAGRRADEEPWRLPVGVFAAADEPAGLVADATGKGLLVWTSLLDLRGPHVVALPWVWDQGFQGAPIVVHEPFTAGAQLLPSLAAGGDGELVAVWESWEEDGAGRGIFARRLAVDGSWPPGRSFRVNAVARRDQRQPRVAVNASGRALAVWEHHPDDGGPARLLAQLLSAEGEPLGNELGLATPCGGDQRDAAVTADPSGSFIVVWSEASTDGSTSGLYAQTATALTAAWPPGQATQTRSPF